MDNEQRSMGKKKKLKRVKGFVKEFPKKERKKWKPNNGGRSMEGGWREPPTPSLALPLVLETEKMN